MRINRKERIDHKVAENVFFEPFASFAVKRILAEER